MPSSLFPEFENDIPMPPVKRPALETGAMFAGGDYSTGEMIFIIDEKDVMTKIPVNTRVRLTISED